jgi:hypothetical protein
LEIAIVVQALAGIAGRAADVGCVIADHVPNLRNACWARTARASAGAHRALSDLPTLWSASGYV